MRRRGAGLVLAVTLAALAGMVATRAQDTVADRANKLHYWPHRVFSIPVDTAAVARTAADKNQPVPTHLQLYTSLARGPWQAGAKRELGKLDVLEDGKKGFSFTADRDGEYEFSVQYHYKDGTSSPARSDELAAMLRVAIDTTLPNVRIAAVGNGVEWAATDDNLDPDGVRLQAKFPNWPEWKTVDTRPFRAADNYAWKLDRGQELDVRVLARDRAGNENYSAPVRVPGTGAFNTGFPKLGGSDTPLPGVGGSGLPQPRVSYVNKPTFDIDYKIDRAGRSGIQAAQLYVQKQRGGWEPVKRYEIAPPASTGATLKLAYTAPEKDEGTYGFYVAPESGAGLKADPPNQNAPPMVFVVYDKSPPFLKITGVRVGAGGAKGPLVEIMWETYDQNLLADPISLDFAIDKDATTWREIRYRLPPGSPRQDGADGLTRYVGQFTWEVTDESLWKFYVRARCVDRASNSTADIRQEPVVVDLEKPAATITGVTGSGSGTIPPPGGGGAFPTPPAPRVNTPAPPAVPMAPVTPPGEIPAGPSLPALPAVPPKMPVD